MKTRLALTIGDPAGIGPEVLLKALADPEIRALCPMTVIGDRLSLEKTYQHLKNRTESPLIAPSELDILEPNGNESLQDFTWGEGSATTGDRAFQCLDTAITKTLEGEFSGIVTAPIAKSLWQAAGHNYPGQTEVLAQKSETTRYGMAFIGKSPYTGWTLRTLLATTHIPLKAVPETLNPGLIDLKLSLLLESLQQDFGLANPQVAIAGLNPHSGENGQLGTEEMDWLNAWLQRARQQYPNANLLGLYPPDTMWVNAGKAWYGKPEFKPAADAYLALYHDQGLIPVKLMAFDYAINTTIGLPFIRTSPDHGTAFDIAGQGIANPTSMKEAIKLAAKISQQRAATTVPPLLTPPDRSLLG
ncbi:4-hydroxythreonine-4-phosphate dehydrogenase PdxA [Picosynechococcus sp. PCC 7003]|uniref:4-hydroxythreonine-4-phosphate dehydrogenase PdxA n=1 Tax=Picosynechococcus sp. PCC 7003 TaxID=374981 RepID=UPI0008104453|nr:4-hydroxythreonine-4-phosphate dehydrogenase PdxA [Picosynechococcus sp. PCC 7003]ANV83635.1 4-hydroxythreonine-4-phosphate dehydrogenase PdxA [Picosynechococcus sp. PCC 7003]